jgi:acetyl-CoA carboxylase carboxyl transferase subunit alpha
MALNFEKPLLKLEEKIKELTKLNKDPKVNFNSEIAALKKEAQTMRGNLYSKLSAWDTVQVARHTDRPLIRNYIKDMFSDFIELHGDRCFGDDHGIIGGFATLGGKRLMLIGHQKGNSLESNIKANFGMGSPEGYRKALRLMKLAEKYSLPIVCLIDTPGAYPGMEAEARGQAEAIAKNLTEMATLEVPIIVVVTGEGGSGGALGIGVGDVVLMLANSVYSVISPEGCASILWRDGDKAPEAAEALKITAGSLLELGIVDEIIPEPTGGANYDHSTTMKSVKKAILKQLEKFNKISTRKLIEKRFNKYAEIGKFKKG